MALPSEDWKRINAWLAKRAPKTLTNRTPGATADQTASAEHALGAAMPAAWRELGLLRDGMKNDGTGGSLVIGLTSAR